MTLAAFFFDHWIWHPLHGLGYQWWSGLGSDLGELTLVASAVTLLAVVWHHLNCHEVGCKRIGRHNVTVDGHRWLVCGPHLREAFPDVPRSLAAHVAVTKTRRPPRGV